MNSIGKIQKDKCYGCYACVDVCPKKCIRAKEDAEGFMCPEIDKQNCVNCGACLRVCPANAEKKVKVPIEIYAAYSVDDEVRYKSTSGGLFYPIAQYVIENGGCAFGAVFDNNFDVKHFCVDDINSVERCMKSKYVQSNLTNVFNEVAERSKSQLVLFSGTPCQVAALKRYPNVNNDNIISVDLICHGVPSPKLWKKHLNDLAKKNGSIKSLITRSKERHGSLQSEFVVMFENGSEYRKVLDKDGYMYAFMNGISLRKTCYNCDYKGTNRYSDITLADFSSIRNYLDDADDYKGVSMITINSVKGKRIIDAISSKISIKRLYNKKCLVDDYTWGKSLVYSRRRDRFFERCFKDELTVEQSAKNSLIGDTGHTIKERIALTKDKANDFILKYVFRV